MKEKIKNFWEANKMKIVGGILFVAGVVLGYSVKKSIEVNDTLFDPDLTSSSEAYSEKHRKVDEEIFTVMAPQIESMVLDRDLTEGHLESTFDVDDVTKKVDVDVFVV